MDFGELNIDGVIDTNVLSGAIPGTDLQKFRILAPLTKLNEKSPLEFQFMFANGQLKSHNATVELQFDLGDITF